MSKYSLRVFKTEFAGLFRALVHPETLDSMDDIIEGDYILVKGNKRTETVLQILTSDEIPRNVLGMKITTLSNLFVENHSEVPIYPCHNIKKARKIEIQACQSRKHQEPEMKRIITGFFSRIGTVPICRGNIIYIDLGVAVKITDCDPLPYALFAVETSELHFRTGLLNLSSELERSNYIGYDNIGGCARQLEMIKEAVDLPLRHPELFANVGVSPPRGILLYGPPGTGKTMIARAVANETGAFFFIINGPEVMSKMAGESEANIRKIFKSAEKNAPSIIFIDEIDSMAPKREGGGEVEKRIVSQLLTLMDGLKPRSNVVVVAATNRPNSLDPALRRYGRFDREINIGVPDIRGRTEILKIHSKKMKMDVSVNLEMIAERTHGFVGADLAQVCTEAGMHCIREKSIDYDREDLIPDDELRKIVVNSSHFEKALRHAKPSSMRDVMTEIPNVSWDDIGGLEDVKRQLNEMVRLPIECPDMFNDFGLIPPKGILFYGPPGCGKTMIAKAVASQCGVNFISIKGPELLNMYFGESESNVRNIFEKARQASPCILFFDELDAIARSRGGGFGGDSASAASDRVINQLLTEMDGVVSAKQIFIIGATNRPEMIDKAVLRPGRLDQLVFIPPPDHGSRMAVFKAALKKIPVGDDVRMSWESLADVSEGYTGADLNEICQSSARNSMKRYMGDPSSPKEVTLSDLFTSIKQARRSVSETDVMRYVAFRNSL